MDIKKQVGQNVARIRKDRGWSQEEFADRAGLHRTYISGIETGNRNPTVTVLDQLAKALGVTSDKLVHA